MNKLYYAIAFLLSSFIFFNCSEKDVTIEDNDGDGGNNNEIVEKEVKLDKNGNPKVFIHRSNAKFDAFDKSKIGPLVAEVLKELGV